MSINKEMFISNSQEWETPQDLFDRYNHMYRFTLDLCATPDNAKCERYFTKKENALIKSWFYEICWMNPPYGREIGRWVQKAYDSVYHGLNWEMSATIVMLLPARTDTKWFQDYVLKAQRLYNAHIHFIKGRLKFVGAKHPAPFPSVVVVFRRMF